MCLPLFFLFLKFSVLHLLIVITLPKVNNDLLQKSNNHRMVDNEFFVNFSWGCKTIRFDDCSQLVIVKLNGWPLCSSSSRLSTPSLNFLKHHCTVPYLVTRPRALLIMWAVSTALWSILYLDKKIAWICFWSYIISIV